MLEKYLRQLTDDLEMEPVDPKDKRGFWRIPLTSEIQISLRALEPGLYLFSPLAPCPKERKEDIFTFLMRGNFLGLGTGGAAVALDAEEKFLTLSLALTYDMNYLNFKETLEDFVNFLDYWRDELIRLEKKE